MGHRILYIPKLKNAIFYPEYGLLYNWYAVRDSRNLANNGWHVATKDDFIVMADYLGAAGQYYWSDDNDLAHKLRVTGTVYWGSESDGTYTATNEYGFNAKGHGRRDANGSYVQLNNVAQWVTDDPVISSNTYYSPGFSNNAIALQVTSPNYSYINAGKGVRLIKDTTTLSHGETGTYTGNDGKIYPTICIGTQEWLADNLSETKFRNNDIIPWHGANPANFFTNAEWGALTTAGMCAYNNDVNYVAPDFTFPT